MSSLLLGMAGMGVPMNSASAKAKEEVGQRPQRQKKQQEQQQQEGGQSQQRQEREEEAWQRQGQQQEIGPWQQQQEEARQQQEVGQGQQRQQQQEARQQVQEVGQRQQQQQQELGLGQRQKQQQQKLGLGQRLKQQLLQQHRVHTGGQIKEEGKQEGGGDTIPMASVLREAMGSTRSIELQLAAFTLVFATSGLVPAWDLAFPALASAYTLALALLAFPAYPTLDPARMDIFRAPPHTAHALVLAGLAVGFFLPLAYLLGGFSRGDPAAVRSAAPHLFLLSAQLLSELLVSGCPRVSPPARVILTLLYTGRRLCAHSDWIVCTFGHSTSGKDFMWLWFGRWLAISNFIYSTFNMFYWLIPRFLFLAFERYIIAMNLYNAQRSSQTSTSTNLQMSSKEEMEKGKTYDELIKDEKSKRKHKESEDDFSSLWSRRWVAISNFVYPTFNTFFLLISRFLYLAFERFIVAMHLYNAQRSSQTSKTNLQTSSKEEEEKGKASQELTKDEKLAKGKEKEKEEIRNM